MKEWMIWLGTGVSLIDEEHMHFLKLIQLVKKSSADQCKRLVSRKFLEHTQTIMKNHFENEEQLMLKLDYDGLSTQIQEQNRILATAIRQVSAARTEQVCCHSS